MSKSLQVSLGLVVAAAVAVIVALLLTSNDDSPAATDSPAGADNPNASVAARDDSARLETGEKATFVEFLDFECEACNQLHPVVEDLRAQFGDDVEFVVRHVPLHISSENAARAAEAAGEQNRFEDMYQALFASSAEWGHAAEPERDAFFALAEEIGLDMDQFEADFDSTTVTDRLARDRADAEQLGVSGTPTFFLDGEMLRPETISDLEEAIRGAID